MGGMWDHGVSSFRSCFLKRKSCHPDRIKVCISPLDSMRIVLAMLWNALYLARAHESTCITSHGAPHWLECGIFFAFELNFTASSLDSKLINIISDSPLTVGMISLIEMSFHSSSAMLRFVRAQVLSIDLIVRCLLV